MTAHIVSVVATFYKLLVELTIQIANRPDDISFDSAFENNVQRL